MGSIVQSRKDVHDLARASCEGCNISFEALPVSGSLSVTVLFQGTGRIYEKHRCLSQLAVKASEKKHRVFMVNGVGTAAEQSSEHSFKCATTWRGDLIKSICNDRHPAIRHLSQAFSGRAMLDNALEAIKAIRSLGCIPRTINLVGYSRGAVSATMLAALLDYLLSKADIDDACLPNLKMVLFDPVSSFHSLDPTWVDRSILLFNPMIVNKSILVFVSLDPLTRFRPQEGHAGEKEMSLTLPANHQGIEGGDLEQEHHQYVSTITRILTMKHFSLGVNQADDFKLMRAALKLTELQADLALRIRWFAKGQNKRSDLAYQMLRMVYRAQEFRPHGEAFIDDLVVNKHTLKTILMTDHIIEVFGKHFPDCFELLDSYFSTGSLVEKQKYLYFFECKLLMIKPDQLGYDLLARIADRLKSHLDAYRIEVLREAKLEELLTQVPSMTNFSLSGDT